MMSFVTITTEPDRLRVWLITLLQLLELTGCQVTVKESLVVVIFSIIICKIFTKYGKVHVHEHI